MSMQSGSAIAAKVDRVRTDTDPFWDVLVATFQSKSGIWPEAAGSEHDMQTLIRGVQIGVSLMGGQFSPPEIPKEPTKEARIVKQSP